MTELTLGSPEQWAELDPNAPAIVDGELTLTYGEWNEQANRLASSLIDAGLGAGSAIGVRTRVRHQWFVVNRAIGKIGGQQIAVNWRLTPQEVRHILADAGAAALFFDDDDPRPLADGLADLGLSLRATIGQPESVPLERYEDLVAAGEPTPRHGAMIVAPVVYTSGTTGKPKGVAVENHVSVERDVLRRYYQSVRETPPTHLRSRFLATMPLHHGSAPARAARCHLSGGCVYLLEPFDAERALQMIAQHRINQWVAVPTMLLRMRSLPPAIRDAGDVSSMQAIVVGGAPVPQALKEWVLDRFGDVLYESYASTETGAITSLVPGDARRKPGSSGRPFAEVLIRIVDDEWVELPVGTTGEIAVKTPVLISRYLGGADLDETTMSIDGYFRTGDVGHVDEDGFLFITDRRKDMIVAGGVNIYPAEIEAAILEHPAVLDCAVVGIPHSDFGEQPLAFIELRAGASLTGVELLEFLEHNLAPYKRPRSIEFVTDLPRNPSGKVLKYELRAPYWQGREKSI